MDMQNKKDFIRTQRNLLYLSLFFIFGMFIRIYKLGSHNLWFDEFVSYIFATGKFGNIYIFSLENYPFRDYTPFLYIYMLTGWMKFFGSSEFALRSLSMIFGVLSILLIYKLGKLFFDTRTGLLSAFILSISPIHIWYSQEARGYSLSTFLVMLIVYFLISALKKNTIYLWAGFIVSSILALYTNYFCFFTIILVSILFLSKDYRNLLKYFLLSLCFIFVVFLPFFPSFLHQANSIKNNFWLPKPKFISIPVTLANFNVGYNATSRIYISAFIIFSLLFILGILSWWQEKRRELIFLISFLFIPIIFTFLISQRIPVYLDRQLMLFSTFYYIIIAAGLIKIKSSILKRIAIVFISISMLICLNNYFSYFMPLPLHYHIGVHVKKPVKPAADYINQGFKDDDLVAISDISIYNISYYMPNILRRRGAHFFIDSKFKNARFLYKRMKESQKFKLQRGMSSNVVNLEEESSIPGVKNIRQLDFKRVWLVSSSWARDGILDSHVRAIRQFMQNHYLLLDTKEFDGIFIDLYSCK